MAAGSTATWASSRTIASELLACCFLVLACCFPVAAAHGQGTQAASAPFLPAAPSAPSVAVPSVAVPSVGVLSAPSVAASAAQTSSAAQPSPPAITLDEAIVRARANAPAFAAAVAQAKAAKLDQAIARSALLPSAVYHNQYLYTQGGAGFVAHSLGRVNAESLGSSLPRFIANNAVHEYVSQASVTETLGPQQFNAVSKASAAFAVASAELEIARRGLTATVVALYYNSLAADRKVAIAQRAATEAANFTKLTQEREQAREAAHADVVKAQLLQQQRERDIADALLLQEKDRLDLGVLLNPDPRSPFSLTPADPAAPLPARADVEAALAAHNPELRSAFASSHLADLNVTSARLGYLPDLALNYSYGIDAAQFAMHNSIGANNLGYAATATLDIPLWDWFTTHNRVRQAQLQRQVARVTLNNTQRQLIADLEEFYSEARVARDQLASFDTSVTTAAESLRLTRLRYTSGEATVLEVVDAQNSMTAAELAREDGTVRYQTALGNLQLLTGTI